jgi:Amt family ammonium transporter
MRLVYLFYLILILAAGLVATFLPEVPQVKVGVPINSGDTAWLLTSSALVLLMTPGLSFFYGGMVRKKILFQRCFSPWLL